MAVSRRRLIDAMARLAPGETREPGLQSQGLTFGCPGSGSPPWRVKDARERAGGASKTRVNALAARHRRA
jgi:hypothetical protein